MVRIRPSPKWFTWWPYANQEGLSYGSNTTKPPNDIVGCAQGAPMFELCFYNRLSLVPIIWVASPQVFFQLAYKPVQRVIITSCLSRKPLCNQKTYWGKNDRGPALAGMPIYYSDHNIYIVKNMYIRRACGSGVIRPKMSNISMAGGSPPPTCVSLCALEHR